MEGTGPMRVQDLDTHREQLDIKALAERLIAFENDLSSILMDNLEIHKVTDKKLDRIEHLQRHHTEEMFDMAQVIVRIEKLLEVSLPWREAYEKGKHDQRVLMEMKE